MNSIMVGYQGMRDMLTSVFGKGKVADGPEEQSEPAAGMEMPRFISTAPKPKEVPVVTAATEKMPKLSPDAFDKMFGATLKGKPH